MKVLSNQRNSHFCGKIHFLSKGTSSIRNAIRSNPVIQDIVKGEQDLYVHIPCREASRSEILQGKDDTQFKIKFVIDRKAKTFAEKIKNIFKRNSCVVSKNYHSEDGIIRLLSQRINKIQQILS